MLSRPQVPSVHCLPNPQLASARLSAPAPGFFKQAKFWLFLTILLFVVMTLRKKKTITLFWWWWWLYLKYAHVFPDDYHECWWHRNQQWWVHVQWPQRQQQQIDQKWLVHVQWPQQQQQQQIDQKWWVDGCSQRRRLTPRAAPHGSRQLVSTLFSSPHIRWRSRCWWWRTPCTCRFWYTTIFTMSEKSLPKMHKIVFEIKTDTLDALGDALTILTKSWQPILTTDLNNQSWLPTLTTNLD